MMFVMKLETTLSSESVSGEGVLPIIASVSPFSKLLPKAGMIMYCSILALNLGKGHLQPLSPPLPGLHAFSTVGWIRRRQIASNPQWIYCRLGVRGNLLEIGSRQRIAHKVIAKCKREEWFQSLGGVWNTLKEFWRSVWAPSSGSNRRVGDQHGGV